MQPENTQQIAAWHRRLINFLIDGIPCGIFMKYGILLLIFHPQLYYLSIPVIYFLYYFMMEYFVGRTCGQMVTDTIPLTKKYEKPAFHQTAIRTLCRLIPLELISFSGSHPQGWHDKISGTRVYRMPR